MIWTVLTLLVWLVTGAEEFAVDFNPVLIAFVLAIVLDLYNHKPWVRA